jgi:peptidoglycan/xylan/chitin deacetylase (PgdA/CDA1 family)
VVLTFDDAIRNHLTYVAPILERHGFRATFFITAAWMSDSEHYLRFPDVAKLYRAGFEIGDHTWTHDGFRRPEDAARLKDEIARLEAALAKAGVPKPVSFAWPADEFGPSPREVLAEAGYHFGRRGMSPEFPLHSAEVIGNAYDPRRNDALLVPSTGVARSDWTPDHFRAILAKAVAGRAVVLQFHGVPDPINPELSTSESQFAEYVRILTGGGYHVIALEDLDRYGVRTIPSRDPMVHVRYPAYE